MRMRRIPLRGEQFTLTDGQVVTIVECRPKGNVRVVLSNGKMDVISKNNVKLPEIDTKDYERL